MIPMSIRMRLTLSYSLILTLTLGLRALTGRFISIYWLNDISVLALSLLQALVLQSWLRRSN